MESMCEVFGWTPKDMEEMDLFYLDAFHSILVGKKEGEDFRKPNK